MNHSLFTGNTSLYLVASLSCARYLYDELAIWSINGFKKQTKKTTYSFYLVFPFLPNPVKPAFPEAGKGFSTALYKPLRILYFLFLEKNMHGRNQASSFKWSSGAWHQIALWVQFYCRHMKAATVVSVEFLEWEILEAKFWPCFCGQLEARLVHCAGLKNGAWSAVKMQVREGCKAKTLNCLSWVGADAEVPVSFLLEKMCKIWRVLVLL